METTVDTFRIEVDTNGDKAASALNKVQDALQNIGKAESGLKNVEKSGKSSTSAWVKLKQALKGVGSEMKKTGKDAEDAGKKARKATSGLLSDIMRIAKYRAIRSVLREITDGFREGKENLYQWSKAFDGASYGSMGNFANIMDNMATTSLYLHNALGTLAANVSAVLAPAFEWLTDKVVIAINALNNLFAVLRGDSTYNKAIRKQEEYAKATDGAAKALHNLLFGFDELNIIPAQGGGGASSKTDYSGMFEEVATNTDSVMGKFAITAKDILFEWDDLKPQNIIEKAITGMSTLFGTVAGFRIGGVPGALIGAFSGLTVSLLANHLAFNRDSSLNQGEVFSSALAVLGAITGGIIGWKLGGVNGALLGATIGVNLGLVLGKGIGNLFSSTLKFEDFSTGILAVLSGVAGAMFGFKIAGFGGALLGASIGVLLSLFAKDDGKLFKDGGINFDAAKQLIIQTLTAGLVGVMAFELGATMPTATLIFSLTMALQKIDWSQAALSIKDAFKGLSEFAKSEYDNLQYRISTGDWKSKRIINVSTGETRYETTRDKLSWTGEEMYQTGMYASGGTPPMGSLFIAGEKGPELVTSINNQSTVYNEDQLARSMSVANEGLINVVIQAANMVAEAVNNKDMSVKIGDRDINNASVRGARLNGRPMVT